MKIFLSLLSVIICAIGIGWYPFVSYYQNMVYEADRAKYDAEKTLWDSIQSVTASHVEDSVFNYWISHNDTTVKSIKKIYNRPIYSETGYYKKTGKWQCEPERHYSKKLVCEPMKEWVITDYYISGYYLDTIWSPGYNNNKEWLNKAHSIAHNEAMRQRVEFHPYNGHKYHFISSSNDSLYLIGCICIGVFALLEFHAIWFFMVTLISFIRGYVADYSKIRESFMYMISTILGIGIFCALFALLA